MEATVNLEALAMLMISMALAKRLQYLSVSLSRPAMMVICAKQQLELVQSCQDLLVNSVLQVTNVILASMKNALQIPIKT